MLERRAERGLATPALDLQPELFEDLADVWMCFWRLNATRWHGHDGAPAMLKTVDIAAAFEIECVEPRERKEWYRLIQAMDVAWMENAVDVRQRQQKKTPEKGRNRGNAARRYRR